MSTIKFINVGRNKKCWEKQITDEAPVEMILDVTEGEVINSGFLMSRDIEAVYSDGDLTQGIITAGFNTVGKFEVQA